MTEKFITARDTALRVADTLRGERTVVLLHGYLESLDVWDTFIPRLSPHVRVVALDLPGHGISEVKGPVHSTEYLAGVVDDALRTLGVGPCTMVGHSMGGYVALAFAERFADRLTGLVLLSSTPYADSEAKRADRLREVALVEGGRKELLARQSPAKGFAPRNRTRMMATIEELAEGVMLTEDEGIAALLRGMAERPDRSAVWARKEPPKRMILGCEDEYIPREAAEKMVADFPDADVVWLPASGHMGFLEEPEACAQAILDFVR